MGTNLEQMTALQVVSILPRQSGPEVDNVPMSQREPAKITRIPFLFRKIVQTLHLEATPVHTALTGLHFRSLELQYTKL